ncbi:hypothetical protein M0802_006475 [Mischocyttarus mexicanus]|nr:hypothetical protein M0802_006475 [Mischocyttarus mexicanus]
MLAAFARSQSLGPKKQKQKKKKKKKKKKKRRNSLFVEVFGCLDHWKKKRTIGKKVLVDVALDLKYLKDNRPFPIMYVPAAAASLYIPLFTFYLLPIRFLSETSLTLWGSWLSRSLRNTFFPYLLETPYALWLRVIYPS